MHHRLGSKSRPIAALRVPANTGTGYSGYIQDDETGLLWMSNRPYDPIVGRVLALDPVVNGPMGQDGANRYAYVYNHPTAFIDPTGFDGFELDFSLDLDFSANIGYDPSISFETPNYEISIGEPSFAPDVEAPAMSNVDTNAQFSSGSDYYSYSGGQAYEGEAANWDDAAAYSSDTCWAAAQAEAISGASNPTNVTTGVYNSDTAAMRATAYSTEGEDRTVEWLQNLTMGDASHQQFFQQRQLFTDMMAAAVATEVTAAVVVGTGVAAVELLPELGVAAAEGGVEAAAAEDVEATQGIWRTLQTGGNTINSSTANALNEAHGLDLYPREWGRALESMKTELGLSNDFHGVIVESGDYLNKAGQVLGNLLDYLP
jgi:RHS repeat-associated protein